MAEITDSKYFYGLGRRKSAVAQVRLYPAGKGKITVNNNAIKTEDATYLAPLQLVGKLGDLDITVKVSGGGFAGQSDAIQLGIARALLELDIEFRNSLKKAGFLTRNPRERERKKYGLKGARRAPQWSKR